MLLLPGLFGRKITKCLQHFVELPLCCDPLSQMVLIGDMAASQGPWLATLSNVQHRLWDHHWAQGATAKNTLKMVIWCYSVTFAGFLVPPICWAFLLFDSCHFRQDSQRSARRSSVDFGITTTEPKEGRQRSARRSSVDFAVTITEPKEDILEIWESENTNEKSCRRVRRGFATLNSIPFSEGGGASLTRTCELFKTTQFWWCIITPLKVLNGCNLKIISGLRRWYGSPYEDRGRLVGQIVATVATLWNSRTFKKSLGMKGVRSRWNLGGSVFAASFWKQQRIS